MKKRLLISILGIFIYAISINNLAFAHVGGRPIDLLILILERVLQFNSYVAIYFFIEMFFLLLLILFKNKLKVTFQQLVISFLSISFLSFIIFLTADIIFIKNNNFNFVLILLLLNFGLFLITQGNIIITPLDKFLVRLANLFGASYGKFRLFFDIFITVILQVLTLYFYNQNSITIELILVIILSGPIIHLYERIYYKGLKLISGKRKRG